MSGPVEHLSGRLVSRFPWVSGPLIVGAPMRVLAGPKLAVSISAAGGLGFLGPAVKTKSMGDDLEEARKLIHDAPEFRRALGAEPTNCALPIGVGFQLWSDDLPTASDLIKQYRPSVAWLFAPKDDPEDYIAWSSEIRRAFSGISIWIQIGTVAEALRLLDLPAPPDALVVQGAEAGGHGHATDGMGLMTLLPEIADAVQKRRSEMQLLGAGGIANGRGAAAALCLGADGVAMGTRFLAATEARISRGYQREIVRASDSGVSTTRTVLYNQLRGTVGWPKHYAPRTIINRSYVDYLAGTPFETLQALHDEALTRGEEAWGPEGRTATYAGASVGLIHDVRDAASLVQNIRDETKRILGLQREKL
ncbi:hypothetical protein RBB50_002169 [Rhinocladiella similis]